MPDLKSLEKKKTPRGRIISISMTCHEAGALKGVRLTNYLGHLFSLCTHDPVQLTPLLVCGSVIDLSEVGTLEYGLLFRRTSRNVTRR